MKSCLLLAVFVGFAVAPCGLFAADSDVKRDLTVLQEQRVKALAAAVEPINQRYATALEQLLRKATQTNDLDTALVIQEELKTLHPTGAGAPVVDIHDAINDTDWTWERQGASPTIHFGKDGTFKHASFAGTWKVVSLHVIRLKASWGETNLTFNTNFTEYKATSGDPEKQGVKGKRK